jgi:2-polyprenyl-6-methoxyphenol hydroxylase-like FAD-dependent oxidoreductase
VASSRALVIGGSLGGLFAAHLLRSVGFDVRVFERVADDLASRGVGLGTHDGLFEVAQRIAIAFDRSDGVAIDSYVCLDQDGRVIYEMPLSRVMIAWAQIYRPLKDALPSQCYCGGKQLERIEQDPESVTAIFADGTRETGDLLIGADGLRSTVRGQFLPALKPIYAGYIAWRAMVPENDIPVAVRETVFGRYAFCLPDGEVGVSYPVPGREGDSRPGFRNSNIVWYRRVDLKTLHDLCTDSEGRPHDISIPPPLVRPEVVAGIKKTSHALLARPIAEIFCACEQPFFQPIYDLASPRIVFGRVALLGDAAFVARPHVGAGVTKAALDAVCLVDSIVAARGDLWAALTGYDVARREFGNWIVARSRQLGSSILARPEPPSEHPALACDPRVKAVIHDYVAVAIAMRDWRTSRIRTV